MKKRVSLLLAVLLLLTSVFSFYSCEKTDDEKINNGDETQETVIDPNNRLSYPFSPNIPEGTRFDGESFGLFIGSTGQLIYAEEETGDLINDCVYRRNALVGEHFGVEMNIFQSGAGSDGAGQSEASATIRSLIEAGDETYHAFVHTQHNGMPQMTLENYFIDWNLVPYINLDDEWWYQNIKEDLCFGDKIFVMTGDYALYIDRIDCLIFNKDIFDELGLDYPYQDVLDGTWTWDKFEELIKLGADDLDGDGLMTYENDQWGLIGWEPEMLNAMLVSAGYSPLERDADNLPILNQNVDEVHEIYERIINVFADGQYAWCEGSDYSSQMKLFSEGRAMFKELFLTEIANFSDVEFDFGIIPMPKWTEDMGYRSRSANMTALTYIPVTNNNLELTGAVLEEMAFQSAKELTPTYFDKVLTVKNTRDVQSEAMLPIIKNNAFFLYHDFIPSMWGMIRGGGNTYSSTFASNLSAYQDKLEEMRELLLDEAE